LHVGEFAASNDRMQAVGGVFEPTADGRSEVACGVAGAADGRILGAGGVVLPPLMVAYSELKLLASLLPARLLPPPTVP
jgi:restriction endonuclease Mrr